MEIAAFNSEGWERVAAEKKRHWATLRIGPTSPLLNPNTRPNLTDNTRASSLWAHYREVLSSGTPEAQLLLTELREADRSRSENPNEVAAIMNLHHRDAAAALNATSLEM